MGHNDVAIPGVETLRLKTLGRMLAGFCQVQLIGFRGYNSKFRPKQILMLPYWILTAVSTILIHRPKWVIVHNTTQFIPLLKVVKILSLSGFGICNDTILTWAMGPDTGHGWPMQSAIRSILESVSAKMSDLVIVSSPLSKRLLAGKTRKIIVMPNLVDTEQLTRKNYSDRRRTIREKLGCGNDLVVTIVGPFDSSYNRTSLLWLRSSLHQLPQKVRWLLIGKHLPHDTLSDVRVTQVGFVNDFFGYLSASDALLIVRSAPTDGALNKMLQAMSLAIPVIVTPEAYKSEQDWLLPGVNIIAAEEDKLIQLMNSKVLKAENLKEVGEKGRQAVEMLYSVSTYEPYFRAALKTRD